MLTSDTFVLQWFWDVGFVTNFPRLFFFFFCLKTMACIPHVLILDERFMTFDKNPLRIFKCEHTKKLSGFAQVGIFVKADLVGQI
jgi:threonyl-tRNA synthetase